MTAFKSSARGVKASPMPAERAPGAILRNSSPVDCACRFEKQKTINENITEMSILFLVFIYFFVTTTLLVIPFGSAASKLTK